MKEPVILRDPIYGSTVWLLVPAGIKEVEGHLHDLAPKYVSDGCDNWDGCTWALCKEDGAEKNRTFIVALKKFGGTPDDVGILSHEMLHVACAILRDVGMKLNSGSEEAYTYLHEWLLVEALKYLV